MRSMKEGVAYSISSYSRLVAALSCSFFLLLLVLLLSTMADKDALKVGSKVWVKDKDLYGTVRFMGTTDFAPGKWIGVELFDPRGKNSGSVNGKEYFKCADNHGLFLRVGQVQVVVDLPPTAAIADPNQLRVGARVWLKDKDVYGFVRFVGTAEFAPGRWVGVELEEGQVGGKNNGVVNGKEYFKCTGNRGLFVRSAQLQVVVPSPRPSPVIPRPGGGKPSGISPPSAKRPKRPSPAGGGGSPKETRGEGTLTSVPDTNPQPPVAVTEEASGEVADLQQKLAILQSKRLEDKARLKELEKYRIQVQQLMDYKVKWSESQTELQQQLKAAKKEVREAQLAKEKAEDEYRELADAVEMATLDKEMAEERCESLQTEAEALKEKIEELTIDLEIIKQEISDSGLEGVASSAEVKQLEQQNSRLKEALMRLRDLTAQDKLEHQRVVKDLEKAHSDLKAALETRDKMQAELKESDALVDELKEQVDAALGAEEMVETLTNRNLDLEEKLEELTDTVTDLEALRDLSEEQEELRAEVEHDLREEVDMTLNRVRQMEMKLDASQETIVDQQQTIEKFRELVRGIQGEIGELRAKGEQRATEDAAPQAQAMMSLQTQLKSSAMKQTSRLSVPAVQSAQRTVEFELRKLEAQQALQQVDLLKTFMPNSFLVSGGDYDAIQVLMLLPRIIFKADLVTDQLKQQFKMDEALGSLSKLQPGPQLDQLVFAAFLIYKLSLLQLLVAKAQKVLDTCEVQLYRQMGGLRDDLTVHERALDVLIELMKKEQLDEGVPLHGIEKGISHFEHLLQSRLVEVNPDPSPRQLGDVVRVMISGADFLTLDMLRLRLLAPEKGQFVAQIKELESFNNELRVMCRKIRRKIPAPGGAHTLSYGSVAEGGLTGAREKQLQMANTVRALYSKCSQRASSLTDGEYLKGGELEEYMRQVVTRGPLQEARPETLPPKDILRSVMSTNTKTVEAFLTALQNGEYDASAPKTRVKPPVHARADMVKAELSDTEGLGFKLEERQRDIMQLKTALKMKAEELSESGVKVMRLGKKVAGAEEDCARKVTLEREETDKFREALNLQEMMFNKTIEILQGDIETLENEKLAAERKLDQETQKAMRADPPSTRRLRGASFGNPLGLQEGRSGAEGAAGAQQPGARQASVDAAAASPLLLARVDSLSKALSFSQHENIALKAQIAKAQLSGLAPLVVPKRLLHRGRGDRGGGKEGGGGELNQTDQEKTVAKDTASLLQELNSVAFAKVIDITKKDGPSPREKLANQLASVLEMKRRQQKVVEEGRRLMASHHIGGMVSTRVTGFPSPQFLKALGEGAPTCGPTVRLRLPATRDGGGGRVQSLFVSPAQLAALHSAVIG